MRRALRFACLGLLAFLFWLTQGEVSTFGQGTKKEKDKAKAVTLEYPPKLPDGKTVITIESDDFLKPTGTLQKGVLIAEKAPKVDFAFFPGQEYEGNPWSNWGDSLAINGKYYASIGDHLALNSKLATVGRTGTGHVYEYDPEKKSFRLLVDTAKLLKLAEGHYTPGKIHSRLDMGDDGWIYFSTHRGSTTVTTDKNHYQGDWIIRTNPKTNESEVVVCGPVPKHCIPTSVLDPKRLIFYGGTAPGTGGEDDGVQFFAYDIAKKKNLYSGPNGPARYMIFARSTGRIYYVASGGENSGSIMRFDPEKPVAPTKIEGKIGLRAATQETTDGMVYTVSQGNAKSGPSLLYSFNTKTEKVEELGPAGVGGRDYITSMDVDATGRYVYYIPGAHGGSELDGSPVVQYDTKNKTRKVIAFLHPHIKEKFGATLVGTFSSALDPKGDKLYINWNVNRGGKSWDCCALTVIHIPESERGK